MTPTSLRWQLGCGGTGAQPGRGMVLGAVGRWRGAFEIARSMRHVLLGTGSARVADAPSLRMLVELRSDVISRVHAGGLVTGRREDDLS